MDTVEVRVASIPAGGVAGRSADAIRSYHVAREAFSVKMDPKSLGLVASLPPRAAAILRALERKGYSRLSAFVGEDGSTHAVYARDTRPVQRRTVRRGGRKAAAAAGGGADAVAAA